jgi:hypothetical protein
MFALIDAVSLAARASGHTRTTIVSGGGFPIWAIILIVLIVVLLIGLIFARPGGRYRTRRYVEAPAPGQRIVEEEEEVF